MKNISSNYNRSLVIIQWVCLFSFGVDIKDDNSRDERISFVLPHNKLVQIKKWLKKQLLPFSWL